MIGALLGILTGVLIVIIIGFMCGAMGQGSKAAERKDQWEQLARERHEAESSNEWMQKN